MYYVGLDVHQRRSSLCILDEHGKQVKQLQVLGTWEKVVEEVAKLPRPLSIAYEASCGYGHLHERLSPIAQRVVVGHPGRMRLIFRSKNKHDRIDGQRIAKLLFLDEVPAVHVPRREVRQWRGLIEFRQRLLAKRVAVKNQLRALLRGNGITAGAPRSLWTRKGTDWLAAVELPGAGDALRRDVLLDELSERTRQIKRVERELATIAAGHPGVALLRTIPGVGIRTAEALVAYIDDAGRFARSHQAGAYFGLVPCQDSSADRTRLGHITKDGPGTVRKLLCEAGWQAARRSPRLKAFFERVMRGDPGRKKIAVVALARHLACVSLAMLRSGECWRES